MLLDVLMLMMLVFVLDNMVLMKWWWLLMRLLVLMSLLCWLCNFCVILLKVWLSWVRLFFDWCIGIWMLRLLVEMVWVVFISCWIGEISELVKLRLIRIEVIRMVSVIIVNISVNVIWMLSWCDLIWVYLVMLILVCLSWLMMLGLRGCVMYRKVLLKVWRWIMVVM